MSEMITSLSPEENHEIRIGAAKAFIITLLASTALGGAIGVASDLYESASLRDSKAAYENADHANQEAQKNLSRAGETVGENCRLLIAPDYLEGGILADVSEEKSVAYLLEEPDQPCGSTPRIVQKNFLIYTNASAEEIKSKKDRKQTRALFIRDKKSESTNETNKFLKIFSLIGLGMGTGVGLIHRSDMVYKKRIEQERAMKRSEREQGEIELAKKRERLRHQKNQEYLREQLELNKKHQDLYAMPKLEDLTPLTNEEFRRILKTSGDK